MTHFDDRPRSVRRLGPAVIALTIVTAIGFGCANKPEHVGAPPDILTRGEKIYSQNKEELIIRHFFDDRRDGFYVDVGCYHAEESSTTAYLEKHLGWSGLAIDAQGWLRAEWEEKRPRTKFFNYLVAEKSGQMEKFYIAAPIVGGLSSTKKEHITEFLDREDVPMQEVELETITLNDLLARDEVTAIDFLSIDIEEAEPAALAGFNIQKYKPALVCIEAGPSIRGALSTYFRRNNYERIDEYLAHDSVNWYYRPKR